MPCKNWSKRQVNSSKKMQVSQSYTKYKPFNLKNIEKHLLAILIKAFIIFILLTKFDSLHISVTTQNISLFTICNGNKNRIIWACWTKSSQNGKNQSKQCKNSLRTKTYFPSLLVTFRMERSDDCVRCRLVRKVFLN